jgi:hypothetical protein
MPGGTVTAGTWTNVSMVAPRKFCSAESTAPVSPKNKEQISPRNLVFDQAHVKRQRQAAEHLRQGDARIDVFIAQVGRVLGFDGSDRLFQSGQFAGKNWCSIMVIWLEKSGARSPLGRSPMGMGNT